MQPILTGCYVAKSKGHSHISKWHVWQDVETFSRNTHALLLGAV